MQNLRFELKVEFEVVNKRKKVFSNKNLNIHRKFSVVDRSEPNTFAQHRNPEQERVGKEESGVYVPHLHTSHPRLLAVCITNFRLVIALGSTID